MRKSVRPVVLGLLSLAAGIVPIASAEAQSSAPTYAFHERGGALILTVRPRSWLDAGNVVRPGAQQNPALSGHLQTASYLNLPPYMAQKERYGEGILPDPILNGPFVGARRPFDMVDFGPFSGRRY